MQADTMATDAEATVGSEDVVSETSQKMLVAIAPVMWFIRQHLRYRHPAELSVPHYRLLFLVNAGHGGSLADIATHLGTCIPTASRIVSALVDRKLLVRGETPGDRRRRPLALTEQGRVLLDSANKTIAEGLSVELSKLSTEQVATIGEAMRVMAPLFNAAELSFSNDVRNDDCEDIE